MKNNESMEMYLETIYTLSLTSSNIHAIDICKALNYSKPSVSRAVKLLVSNEYILVNKDGVIELTDKGLEKAKDVYERHNVFTKLFMSYGAPRELAEEDACRVEHYISAEMFEIIKSKIGD